jgi:hypothetical protein
MPGLDNFETEQLILAYAKANINWYVDSGAVPDATTLHYNNGSLDPYVIVRFSDVMPTSGGGSFLGATNDEYYSYVDFMCVAATDVEARELRSVVNRKMIGKRFPNTGELNKRFGGGIFSISLDAQHPLAFIAIASYTYSTNLSDVGSGSLVV